MEDFDNGNFSKRFLARSNISHPQSPWFDTSIKTEREIIGTQPQVFLQDEELENNPGRLLAAERERLKLRERQVQRNRTRSLVTLPRYESKEIEVY